MPTENVAEGVPVEIAGRVVDILFLVWGPWTVVFVTCCVTVLVEVNGKLIIDGLVYMLVFWMISVGVGSILLLDDIIVAAVVKDFVILLVVLEGFWTVGILVCGVVMLGESDGGGI